MAATVRLGAAREFVARYVSISADMAKAADEIRAHIERVLSDANVAFHVVAARAKSSDSVRAKLLAKDYSNPFREMTDQIGARVIVYRSEEVDVVADIIRRHLKVIKKDSVDKRLSLGLREFGYRSYHLVCRTPKAIDRASDSALRVAPPFFEIQIRSILEHSWAEIEHGVAYKSGAELPGSVKRRFASVAGVLELLEQEFQRLAADTEGLVDDALRNIASSSGLSASLDVPHLVGSLEHIRPNGRGFRRRDGDLDPFPPGIERQFVLAFRRCGFKTRRSFLRFVRDEPRLAAAIGRYAATEGIPGEEVSHLAVCVLALGLRSGELLKVFFPDFAADPQVAEALQV